MSYFHRVFRIAMESDTDSPIEALAAQAVQAEAVSSGLAEAAEEVAQMEAATAAELGLTTEELEVFMMATTATRRRRTPLPRAAPPWPRWRT